jgi:hypothetical protein
MGWLDVCAIGHGHSDAGDNQTHESARTAADHEIIAGASGVGDES